jgi:hypothetical protein
MPRAKKPDPKPPPAEAKPKAWMQGLSIGWLPQSYVFGDGLQTSTAVGFFEVIPYVTAPGGIPAGWTIVRDGQRSGFVRVPGAMELAVAQAELLIMAEAARRPQ